jgi:hypothetical protein
MAVRIEATTPLAVFNSRSDVRGTCPGESRGRGHQDPTSALGPLFDSVSLRMEDISLQSRLEANCRRSRQLCLQASSIAGVSQDLISQCHDRCLVFRATGAMGFPKIRQRSMRLSLGFLPYLPSSTPHSLDEKLMHRAIVTVS